MEIFSKILVYRVQNFRIHFFLSLKLQNLIINFSLEWCQFRKINTGIWTWEPQFPAVRMWATCWYVSFFKT